MFASHLHFSRLDRPSAITPLRTAFSLRAAVSLCAALLLSACSTPYSPPQFTDTQTRFPGLLDIAAQAGGKNADVLLVHGICTHDASWATQIEAQLLQSSNAAASVQQHSVAVQAKGDGQVRIITSDVNLPSGHLRFDALIWSPLTQPLKRQLCYDQTNKSADCEGATPYTPVRARFNAKLKDGLIDDCLPDALIYQGVARDEIQRRMRDAILQALSRSDETANTPLIVISHSMGSKILFDTLLRMTQEESGTRAATLAQSVVNRMRFLVMAANQIPLLSLADQQISGTPAPMKAGDLQGVDSLQLLLQRRFAEKPTLAPAQSLTLVAFTDPSDLLSYTLPAERYTHDGVAVFNILVSNAPTYLGLLERPDYAHLNYLSNPEVGRLIACGQPASKLCKQD